MKTMIAKYPGHCCDCGKAIKAQTPIKFFGRGRAAHLNCYNPDGKTEGQIASEYRGACWVCGDMSGQFRNMGAGSPVWCDACFEKERAKTYTVGNVRFQRRDNSSAEDACCGDLAYEDACAAACGL